MVALGHINICDENVNSGEDKCHAFINHEAGEDESLLKLSLKYNIDPELIKKANNLHSDDFILNKMP